MDNFDSKAMSDRLVAQMAKTDGIFGQEALTAVTDPMVPDICSMSIAQLREVMNEMNKPIAFGLIGNPMDMRVLDDTQGNYVGVQIMRHASSNSVWFSTVAKDCQK